MRMKFAKRFAAVAAAAGCLPTVAHAAVNYTGAPYSEFFDSLPTSGTTSLNGTGQPNALANTGFEGAKVGGTGSTLSLIASEGTSTTGALYSFGTGTSSDRA